ncbi:ComEC/Rec2 family competence protein [Flavobacterium paronense]|uniref:ComEC/Rec2 family competence protein n=1 Tax=Flavobacterium paronense TaxID=1392775 RepID=A0ABV5GDU6_9FLAO|nr:ComEC/Rec2 family competence protein [Flavobacterium paronense]MDN3678080.1 ComEC/Rec2 family competence protein [Flavobacterium paronense]
MKILQFPLARIFIGFLFGILLCRIVSPNSVFVFCSLAISILILFISSLYSQKNSLIKILFGSIVFLVAFLIGISTRLIHKENLNPYHYTNQITDYEKVHNLDLLLVEKLKSTTKNNRYISLVKQLDGGRSFGKVILNITKKDKIKFLKIGTHLKVIGIVFKNKNPLNPNLFDYGKYLENQEIYAQVYSKPNQIKIRNYESSLWSGFSNFRETIISNLEHSAISKEELNVLNALILGQQQDISHEVLKDYQYAGAVHVLSVSGLHVGFILLFITFLLKPIGNSRKGSLLKLIIIVLSLWSFAILAGLSPSIVRSVTMFSFLAIGIHLRRTVNIYHTLLVSMLLILLFKPSFLFDVGFQLSYLALFFILWLQPVLSGIWQPNNKIIKYFWDIITVSFAAQIGAMPLSIYYFHQFPGLFFVTNLLILPLLGIIMAVGVLVVLIATFHTVPEFIAKSIEFLITFLNLLIHWVASFDAFVLKNISFTSVMLWSSYLVIILIVIWIKRPTFKRLSLMFICILFLQVTFIIQKKSTQNNEELIIFNCKKNTIITERIGNNVTVYSNDSIQKKLTSNMIIQSYLIGNFCKATAKKPLQNLLYFNHQKILIIDSLCVYRKEIHPDILVIIQSPKLNIQRLLKTYKPKQIVVDGSNYKSYVRLWEATCIKEKIPFHYTNEKGFYKI